MVQTIVQDSSDSASNSSDSASVISNTSNAMAQPERGRRTLVVFTPADAEGPAAIQALATVFPRSASIAFGPSKKGKRIAYVNFHSEKAFEEAATKIGQNITICGLRTTVMSHVAKPPLNKPQPQPSQSSQTKEPPKPGPSLQPASSDAAKAHIWYFWDIENLQIPKRISVNGAYIHDLVASIRKHCEDIYPNHMHMEFQAMYAQQNVLSDGARESLHLCSVSLQQYPGRHVKKEQADKCIVTSMNTREHHTAAGKYEQRVFVILTNDGGYQASEIFKKAADYCIPSTWIFDAVKTPNESVVTPYPLNESHDMLNVPNARSRSKSPAPAPRPNKRTMGKEKGAAHGSQAYQNPNGQAGDSSQNNETGPTAQTPPKDCLRINLPQKLGSVTVPILRNCFGPDANVFIKSPQYPNRHAIVTFKDTAKIFRFAGERILVNGEFVNVILVKGTNFRAPPPPAPSPLAPHPPQNQVKDVNVPVPCSPSKFQYITKNRDEFNRICKDIKVTLDQTHAIVKLKGPSTLVGKADDDLKKWLANIQEYAIPDNDFDWFGAKLFFRYHLQRISIQWAVSICLYRHGNNQPVTGLTSYNSDTDAAVKYKVTLVGELKQPGVREATKEIRNLKLGKPVVLELTDRSGAELFERCEESRNVTKIISISNEHHAYIHIQNNQAFIYAFTDKEKEGARKTLESILVGQHTIQVDPIRYQYILRYRSSGMEAIRCKYHAVQITSTSSKEVAKAMQNPSNASGSSDTPSKHDDIILEGPVADITSATAAVEALLNNVNLEHVDVSFPLRHEIMAFRRYESLATTVQSQKNVVVEFSRKVATIEAVTISVVASGEGDVVKETLEEFSAIRFLAKGTYTIPPDKHYPVGRQLDAFKASMLDDLNVSLNFRGRVVDFNAETSESISSAKEGLKSFLEGENTTKVYSIPNDRHRSWFEKYKKEHEIVAIAKRHQTCSSLATLCTKPSTGL
ncbi:hypothetical protein BC938DRAFT_472929 [Jimgerdemannia flammicorona]|uniref:RRM domain-containing protein n=1 Tax=Jimgerdemannia flammicorona TaxID=994334 RepID=A0A433Q553_9FUNG|nr:hypothetical protein BC938DRAFT_472929 [Jimgerdemannia flammicorona]